MPAPACAQHRRSSGRLLDSACGALPVLTAGDRRGVPGVGALDLFFANAWKMSLGLEMFVGNGRQRQRLAQALGAENAIEDGMTDEVFRHLLPPDSWDICTEEDAAQILSDTRSRKAADPSKIYFFAVQLQFLHSKFTASASKEELSIPSPNGDLRRVSRTRPSRQLRTIQNASRKLDQLLDQDKYPLVADALKASAASRNYPYEIYSSKFDVREFYADLKSKLNLLDDLIEHLVAKKSDFSDLDPSERSVWLLAGERDEEWEVRRNLYPYLQKSEGIHEDETNEGEYHDDPRYVLMREIASLYEEMFGAKFNMKQRYDQPNFDTTSDQARYHGSGVRFACAIIQQLKLEAFFLRDSKTSGNTEQVRLINRLGHIWTNMPK